MFTAMLGRQNCARAAVAQIKGGHGHEYALCGYSVIVFSQQQ